LACTAEKASFFFASAGTFAAGAGVTSGADSTFLSALGASAFVTGFAALFDGAFRVRVDFGVFALAGTVFFTGDFLVAAFLAGVFLEGAFFAAVFLAGAFFADAFFVSAAFVATFFAGAFFVAAFLAGAFFGAWMPF